MAKFTVMKQLVEHKSSVWMKRFQNGRHEVTENKRFSHTETSVTDSDTDKVTQMVSSDNLLPAWKMSEELT
jgi:hypothetical protein